MDSGEVLAGHVENKGQEHKDRADHEGPLEAIGYRYEFQPKMLGNPDFVIRRGKITIFYDGDFWHGYKYNEHRRLPTKFWRDKIE